MFRGDVWDVRFPAPIGLRPCVVLTTNALIGRLVAVTVAEITGTEGPGSTHVEVDPETGFSGRPRSWVNVTGLHTLPKGKLRRHRGRLSPVELGRVGTAVCAYLDLDDDDWLASHQRRGTPITLLRTWDRPALAAGRVRVTGGRLCPGAGGGG